MHVLRIIRIIRIIRILRIIQLRSKLPCTILTCLLAPSQGSLLKNSGCCRKLGYIIVCTESYIICSKQLKQKKHVYVNTYYKIFTFIHSNYIALKLYSFSADNFEYCVAIVSLLRNKYITNHQRMYCPVITSFIQILKMNFFIQSFITENMI